MTTQEISSQLAAPFADSDLEWRLQWIDKDKTKGTAVPYVTNRAIQNRLDTVLGIDGWKNEYHPWHPDKKSNKDSQLCGISIWIAERGEWITKFDGAEDSDIESVKGGLSDSMKRAAVHWGVGRYLYNTPTVYVELEREKYIKQSEYARLNAAHQAVIARVFQQNAPAAQNPLQTKQQASTPQPRNTVQVQPRQQQATSPSSKPAPEPAPARKPQPSTNSYTITKVATVASVKRGKDTSLQLEGDVGKSFEVYVYNTNPKLKPGVVLSDCKITPIKNGDVVFYLLEEYTINEQQKVA